MVSEVLENAAALEITSVHVYANQSQIVSGWKRNARSPQQILLEDVLPLYPQISQRVSGDVIERGTVYSRREQSRSPSLLQELLKGLENSASSYLDEKLGVTRGVLPEVQFQSTDDDHHVSAPLNTLVYVANSEVWSRILIGELTIEAISIGGAGNVLTDPSVNIAPIHHLLTRWAYQIQVRIREQGCTWLLANRV